MIYLAVAFLIFSAALPAYGQQIQPRIQVRVVGDGLTNDASFGSELSSTVYVDEVGSEQKGQLERIRAFLDEEQWTEAVDMLLRLSESDLSKLAAEPNRTTSDHFAQQLHQFAPLSQSIRRLVHELAMSVPNSLLTYRERIDPLAKQWLETGRTNRDTGQLEQLVTEAFHSSHGDEALLTLGDWALEDGTFDKARRYFELIHPDFELQPTRIGEQDGGEQNVTVAVEPGHAAPNSTTAYINSDIPRAIIGARLVLVSILEGNQRRASAELALLRKRWPDAEGQIGGRQGKLTDLLEQLPSTDSSHARSKRERQNWQTFAGDFARNSIRNFEIDIPMRPLWKTPMAALHDEVQADQFSIRKRFGLPTESSGELTDKPCRTFPIVFDGKVIFKDLSRIHCIDLETGKPAWSRKDDGCFFEHANIVTAPTVPFGMQKRSQLGQHRFTLCCENGLLTATMGSSLNNDATNSTVVGFDFASQGAIQFGPIAVENSSWTFHGAPLHDEHRCWVGMRLSEATAQDFLACFDVHTGKQLWKTRICTAETMGGNAIEATCNFLLTQYEDTIYISSHLGTIAAVAAKTGKLRWVTQYARRGPITQNLTDQSWHSLRDVTPCVIHNEILIAAPSDSDQVFALNKHTGELLWNTPLATDATKILGITEDATLIMSGRRLWWLDAYTGKPSQKATVNPFPANVASTPTGIGRGLISAGKVYWPAVENDNHKIYVLDQHNGQPARQPIDLEERGVQAGNLAVVPGYLLISGPEELAVFSFIE